MEIKRKNHAAKSILNTCFVLTTLGILLIASIQPAYSGSWTWYKLTGKTLDEPSMDTILDSTLYLYIAVRGADNKVYYSSVDTSNGVQSQWYTLGGTAASGPSIVTGGTFPSVYMFISVRGTDSGIYWYWTTHAGWQKLTGKTLSRPAIAIVEANLLLYVLVRGSDNGIYWCTVDLTLGGFPQSSWHKLAGSTIDSPSIYISGNTMFVAVRGNDNGVYWCTVDVTTHAQGAWHKLTGATASGPTVRRGPSAGYITIAVRGVSNNKIYYAMVDTLYNGHAWSSLPGSSPSSPALVVPDPGTNRYFCVRGMDDGIYATGYVIP